MKTTVRRSAAAMAMLLGSASLLAQPGVAQAQAANDSAQTTVADIVVTAQRREESSQTVPIAVTAFSFQALERMGVSSTREMIEFVPNVVAQNNTGLGSAAGFFIRGVGNTESIPTFDTPVGTYVDDIYIARQSINDLSLFDVSRVEVLRGPQGTLFGRNTTGGAVSVIMRDPGDTMSGFAEVGYGSYEKKMARASIDLPLAPTLAVKVSGYYQDDDGFVKNTTTGDRLNDEDGWGVRVALKGELTPSTTFRASYMHVWSGAENYQNFECDPAEPTNCNGRFATTGYTRATSTTRFPTVTGRKALYGLGNDTATDLLSMKLDTGIAPNTTLSFITGYVATSSQFSTDVFDGRGPSTTVPGLAASSNPTFQNPYPTVAGLVTGSNSILTDTRAQQFSQEIKLDGSLGNGLVDYVAGVFYFNERVRTDIADVFRGTVTADRKIRNTTEAWAGYAQADLNVTSQIKITGGIRYTSETKTLGLRDNRRTCAPAVCLSNDNLFASNGVAIPDEQTAKLWTPRVAVSYRPSDSLMVFASATRGFKSGGWNARGGANSSFLPFGPEKVWSYEAGFKSELFDRRVRLNVTAFHMDITDLQTQNAAISPTGGLTFTTRNFANFKNTGIEAELTVVPVRGLTLYANGGWQNARYVLPENAPDQDIYGFTNVAALIAICRDAIAAGRLPTYATPSPNGAACGAGIITVDGKLADPVRAPNFTVSLGGNYEIDLGTSGMSLVPSVNAIWRSSQETASNNMSIYTGSMTGVATGGATYTVPTNPYSGEFITGSYSAPVWIVNATLTLFGPDQNWSVAARCTNCFDEAAITSTIASTQYLTPPRRWMVSFRKQF
jgi:iron complex outermembrane receptor protein